VMRDLTGNLPGLLAGFVTGYDAGRPRKARPPLARGDTSAAFLFVIEPSDQNGKLIEGNVELSFLIPPTNYLI
jgi:hypothetical protein